MKKGTTEFYYIICPLYLASYLTPLLRSSLLVSAALDGKVEWALPSLNSQRADAVFSVSSEHSPILPCPRYLLPFILIKGLVSAPRPSFCHHGRP